MTLTKHKMVAEIGRRTRLKNRDVQAVIDVLIEVWIEELQNGKRIEIEDFLVIDVQTVMRSDTGITHKGVFRQISVRASKALRRRLNATSTVTDQKPGKL